MHDLAARLDDLAHLMATPADDGTSPCARGAVVADLEDLAGLERGRSDDDTVLLARRFARAHRRLLEMEGPPDEVGDRLEHHARILRDPATALLAAWSDWQDLRRQEAPFDARVAAIELVSVARRAVCR